VVLLVHDDVDGPLPIEDDDGLAPDDGFPCVPRDADLVSVDARHHRIAAAQTPTGQGIRPYRTDREGAVCAQRRPDVSTLIHRFGGRTPASVDNLRWS
jgi:hypothetical protein